MAASAKASKPSSLGDSRAPAILSDTVYQSSGRHARAPCSSNSLVSFFVASRRRHTRSLCDWSSDVCSSDLARSIPISTSLAQLTSHGVEARQVAGDVEIGILLAGNEQRCLGEVDRPVIPGQDVARSEERRVGKECRSRWSPYH